MDFKHTNQGNKSTNQHKLHYFGLCGHLYGPGNIHNAKMVAVNVNTQYKENSTIVALSTTNIAKAWGGNTREKRLYWQMENGK